MTDLVILSVCAALAGAVFVHAAEEWISHEGVQCAARATGCVLWGIGLSSVLAALWKAASA